MPLWNMFVNIPSFDFITQLDLYFPLIVLLLCFNFVDLKEIFMAFAQIV